MEIRDILQEKLDLEGFQDYTLNDIIDKWSKYSAEKIAISSRIKYLPKDKERYLEEKRLSEITFKENTLKQYVDIFLNDLFKRKKLDENLLKDAKKEVNDKYLENVKVGLLKKIQEFGGDTEEGKAMVMDIYRAKYKKDYDNIKNMKKFLDNLNSERAFFAVNESFYKELSSHLEDVKKNFNLKSIDNFRTMQWYLTLKRNLRDLGRRPFGVLLESLPFLGLDDLLKNMYIDGILYSEYEKGKLSKDDIISYLGGSKKLGDLITKLSGENEVIEKIQNLWANKPILLGDLTDEQFNSLSDKDKEKIISDTKKWMELKRGLEKEFLKANTNTFIHNSVLKLLPFLAQTSMSFVGYDLISKSAKNIIKGVLKGVGYIKLPDISERAVADVATASKVAMIKSSLPTLEKKALEIEKALEKEVLKVEKTINKNVMKSIKRQISVAEPVPMFEYVAKNKPKALEIAKSYRALEVIDKKIDDIYENVSKVVGKKIKDYDSLTNVLKADLSNVDVKVLDANFKNLTILNRLRDNYANKFLNLVSSTPKEIKAAANLANRNPMALEGKALSLEIQRMLNMYLGEPANSVLIKSLYKMYNPQELKNIHALRDKLLYDIVKTPLTYKDLIASTSKDLGFSGVLGKLWDENLFFRRNLARVFSVSSDISNTISSAIYSLISPYNFNKDKVAKQVINFTLNSSLLAESFIEIEKHNLLKVFKSAGINFNSPESKLLGQLLYFYKSWDDVPVVVKTKYPNLENVFKYIRSKYDVLAYAQHSANNKWLGMADRIDGYHRINWDHILMRESVGLRMSYLKSLKTLTKEEKEELKLLNRIKGVLDTGDFDKIARIMPYVPSSVAQPHLKKRTLQRLIGIERDFFEKAIEGGKIHRGVFDIPAEEMYFDYLSNFGKLMFEQPALQYYRLVSESVKDGFSKAYLNWFMRNFYGFTRSKGDSISLSIALMEYLLTIGFNVRTALVNLTQNLNTYAELGPNARAYMEEALSHIVSKNDFYKKAMKYFPYFGQLQGLKTTFSNEPVSGSLTDIAFFLMSKTEYANRMMAYMSGYVKAYKEGAKIKEVADFLKKGYTLEEAASKYATDVMRKTQFIYGRGGMPKLFQIPFLRPATVFLTYPVKEVELFIDWAKANPLKLFSYIMLANELNDSFDFLGIDLANAFTIGVNLDNLFLAGKKLIERSPYEASMYAKLAVSPEWGGGGIVQLGGLPGLDILQRAIRIVKKLRGKEFRFGDLLSLNLQFSRIIDAYDALKEGYKSFDRVKIEAEPEKGFISLKNLDSYGFDVFSEDGLFYIVHRGDSKNGFLLKLDELLGYFTGGIPSDFRKVRMVDKFTKMLDDERTKIKNRIKQILLDIRDLSEKRGLSDDLEKIKEIDKKISNLMDEYSIQKTIFYLTLPDKNDRSSLLKLEREIGSKFDVVIIKDLLKKAKESIFTSKVRSGAIPTILNMMKEDYVDIMDVSKEDKEKLSDELDKIISEPVKDTDLENLLRLIEKEYPGIMKLLGL